MNPIRTHYDNLKVARNAPLEVIKAAYRSLALKYHPDRYPDTQEATRIMKILNASFEVLSDSERRAAHDEWIKRNEHQAEEFREPIYPTQENTVPTQATPSEAWDTTPAPPTAEQMKFRRRRQIQELMVQVFVGIPGVCLIFWGLWEAGCFGHDLWVKHGVTERISKAGRELVKPGAETSTVPATKEFVSDKLGLKVQLPSDWLDVELPKNALPSDDANKLLCIGNQFSTKDFFNSTEIPNQRGCVFAAFSVVPPKDAPAELVARTFGERFGNLSEGREGFSCNLGGVAFTEGKAKLKVKDGYMELLLLSGAVAREILVFSTWTMPEAGEADKKILKGIMESLVIRKD